MRRHDGPVQDALVDAYRDILAIKHNVAAQAEAAKNKPITPGAGVDPGKVCRPSKRLRSWHRATHDRDHMSFKQYVRMVARLAPGEESKVARAWLARKGVRP